MKNGLISLAENVIQTTEVLRYSNGTFYDTEVSFTSLLFYPVVRYISMIAIITFS